MAKLENIIQIAKESHFYLLFCRKITHYRIIKQRIFPKVGRKIPKDIQKYEFLVIIMAPSVPCNLVNCTVFPRSRCARIHESVRSTSAGSSSIPIGNRTGSTYWYMKKGCRCTPMKI